MHIPTVSGPVAPELLEGVLMHEHLEAIALDGFLSGGEGGEGAVPRALRRLPDQGIGTVVSLAGRSRVAGGTLDALDGRLPVHVVAGFSFYKDPWLAEIGIDDLDELTALYIDRSREGIGGVRIGVFGEVGTSLDDITPLEELQLRAAARAHLATGLAISTHCTLGTMALEQAEILMSEGVDPTRVVIGHLDLRPDLEYLTEVLATGMTLGFDTFGKEWFDYQVPGSEQTGPGAFVKWAFHRPDDDRIRALAELCALGHDHRIVVSSDMSGAEAWLNPDTHGHLGYGYIPRVIVPRLRQAGVAESSIRRILVENPARILAVP